MQYCRTRTDGISCTARKDKGRDFPSNTVLLRQQLQHLSSIAQSRNEDLDSVKGGGTKINADDKMV